MAWKLFSRRPTVKPSRRTYFKPQLEALEDRTLLDNGFGLIFPSGTNQVAPTPLHDLSNNLYWQMVSSGIMQSPDWLTELAPSLSQSDHFTGSEFGGVFIKPLYLQGTIGTKVQYKDIFTVPDILDPGSTTNVTINGSETLGSPNTLNVTLTAVFTDPNFLGTGSTFTVNSSSNTQYNGGQMMLGWSGSGTLSGSGLFYSGDKMQMNVSVSRPQSSGLPDLTWQTDTKYTALNVMTSEDTMETDLRATNKMSHL